MTLLEMRRTRISPILPHNDFRDKDVSEPWPPLGHALKEGLERQDSKRGGYHHRNSITYNERLFEQSNNTRDLFTVVDVRVELGDICHAECLHILIEVFPGEIERQYSNNHCQDIITSIKIMKYTQAE